MKKEPRLTYRGERSKPFIVRYYDGEGRRLTKAFAAKMDATNFMMELTDDRPRKRIRPEHMRAHSAYQPKSRMQTTQSATGGDDSLPDRLYKEQALYQSDVRRSPRHVPGRIRQVKIRYGTWKYYRYKVGKLLAHFGEKLEKVFRSQL